MKAQEEANKRSKQEADKKIQQKKIQINQKMDVIEQKRKVVI